MMRINLISYLHIEFNNRYLRARRLAWLGRRPYESMQFINLLYSFFETSLNPLLRDSVIHFSPDSLEKFKAWLISQGRTKKTIRDHMNYLKKLVNKFGWSIDIYKVIEYLSTLSHGQRNHYRKALRLYLKFINRKEFLELLSGKWTSNESEKEPGITLEQAKEIIEIAATLNIDYALYLAALLITGIRPKELKTITWDDQMNTVDPKIFKIKTSSQLKRSYYAFLTPNLLKLLEKTKRTRSNKLVHWRRETEHNILKIIKTKYPTFRPYELRSLNTYILYMNKVDVLKIKLIHGWIPKAEVMTNYYLIKHLNKNETLLEILDTHNKVFKEIDEWIGEVLGRKIQNSKT